LIDAISQLDASDWIAFFAVIIAAIALIVSLVEICSNRPKLHVIMSNRIGVGDLHGRWDVGVEVTNVGRQPTTVQSVSLKIKGTKKVGWPLSFSNQGSTPPLLLHVGEVAQFVLSGTELIEVQGTDEKLIDAVNSGLVTPQIGHSWAKKPQKARFRGRTFVRR